MKPSFQRFDTALMDPHAPSLQAADPLSRRVISVMPLALNMDEGVCFAPGTQAQAFDVALQLARLELERTLHALNPDLAPWLQEKGRLWPWIYKRGKGPGELESALKMAIDKVNLVLEVDHAGSFWPFLNARFHTSCSHNSLKKAWKTGEAPLVSIEDLDEDLRASLPWDFRHLAHEPSDIPVIPEIEVKSRWEHDHSSDFFAGINFPLHLGFTPITIEGTPNCKGVSAGYLRVIAERLKPALIYRVSEHERRMTPQGNFVGRVTQELNIQGKKTFELNWPHLAKTVEVAWYSIDNFSTKSPD